jgi:hypothetical protein
MAMYPLDDIETRLRRAARPDDRALQRVTSAALAAGPARPWSGLAIPLAALFALIAFLAIWRSQPATLVVSVESSGDAVSLRAPDGTTWFFAGPGTPEYLPTGTCLVIPAGGTR